VRQAVLAALMALTFLAGLLITTPVAQASAVRDRIVSIANAEVGASEANGKCTKYGPCLRYEWCAIFTEWVWKTAGVKHYPVAKWVATDWGKWGLERNLFKRRPAGTRGGNPQPGDVAIYGEPGYFNGHIAVVTEVKADGTIVTVDGNYGEAVARNQVDPLTARAGGGNVLISGYVSPPEADNPSYVDNDLPRYQSTGRVVAAPSLDGRLEMFAGGADGIWHRYQTQVNGGWSAWEPLGGIADARLGLGRSADGRLELFAVNDTTTLHRYQTQANAGWSGWSQIGGGGTDIAVMPSADGRLEVFLAGHEQVWHRYQRHANGDWSDWSGIGGAASARLGFGRSGDGRLEVFAVNDTTTVQTWQTAVNGGWAAWSQVAGGGTDIAVAPAADGRLEVFLAGHEQVWHRYQRSHQGDWTGWTGIGGLGLAQISAARNADGRLEIVTTDGTSSQQSWQTAPNQGFAAWQDMHGHGRDLNLATNDDGRLEIHLAGDDQIWTRHQQTPNGNWTGWNPTGGPTTN
jgi:hypothetical protein